MLAKLLFIVTIFNLSFGTNIELPRHDLIIMPSGERVEGHIQSVMDGVIIIDTDYGEKTIVRDVNIYSPRDIVDVGIIFNKRISGCVKYLGDETLMIDTTSGKQTINRALIRKIIISHDSTLPPMDL